MRGVGSSGENFCGGCSLRKSRWRFFVEWTGRPGANFVCGRKYSQADRTRADFRDLPGASIVRPGARRANVQAEVWAPRLEPSREESADGQGRNHGAEPRLCRGPGFAAIERSRDHTRE